MFLSYSENSENGYPLAETLTMDGIGNPEQMMIDQENVAQFWEKLRTHLSKMEREVLDQYLAGFHYQQIAEKMGKSPNLLIMRSPVLKQKFGRRILK